MRPFKEMSRIFLLLILLLFVMAGETPAYDFKVRVVIESATSKTEKMVPFMKLAAHSVSGDSVIDLLLQSHEMHGVNHDELFVDWKSDKLGNGEYVFVLSSKFTLGGKLIFAVQKHSINKSKIGDGLEIRVVDRTVDIYPVLDGKAVVAPAGPPPNDLYLLNITKGSASGVIKPFQSVGLRAEKVTQELFGRFFFMSPGYYNLELRRLTDINGTRERSPRWIGRVTIPQKPKDRINVEFVHP